MNILINIYHQNSKHNFKIKANIDVANNAVVDYINHTFETKLSNKEINLIHKLIGNNCNIPNNIKYISRILKTSTRTAYRIRKRLISLSILSIHQKTLTFSKYSFEQFNVIIKY